jgi:hypothetical protein
MQAGLVVAQTTKQVCSQMNTFLKTAQAMTGATLNGICVTRFRGDLFGQLAPVAARVSSA